MGDFHSGLRAYSKEVLDTIPYEINSNDFAFDQEFLIQAVSFDFKIGDIPVPVRYFEEASSINFRRSLTYGQGALAAIFCYFLHKSKLRIDQRFISKVSDDVR